MWEQLHPAPLPAWAHGCPWVCRTVCKRLVSGLRGRFPLLLGGMQDYVPPGRIIYL